MVMQPRGKLHKDVAKIAIASHSIGVLNGNFLEGVRNAVATSFWQKNSITFSWLEGGRGGTLCAFDVN